MAVIKGYSQMLLSDIMRVRGHSGTLFDSTVRWPLCWPRWPAHFISLMMAHYIREAEARARAKQTITNRGTVAKIWCSSQWDWRESEEEREREIKGQRKNKEFSRGEKENYSNNHRPPPLIVSGRKLNIDQSKRCETTERGEIERSEQRYK